MLCNRIFSKRVKETREMVAEGTDPVEFFLVVCFFFFALFLYVLEGE